MRMLSTNTGNWSKEIQEEFYEDFPIFTKYPIRIELKNKDLERGYALGKIIVTPNFIIPVIINKGQLEDFDVAIVNGNTIPLIHENLMEMLMNPSAFAETETPSTPQTELDRLFSPMLSYPKENYKTAEFVDRLLPSIKKENQDLIRNCYNEDDLAFFIKNRTDGILLKILEKTPEESNFEKIAEDSSNVNRIYKNKIDRFNSIVYMGDSRTGYVYKTVLSNELADGIMNKYAEQQKESFPEEITDLKASEPTINKEGFFTDGKNHIPMLIKNDITMNGERRFIGINNLNKVSAVVSEVKEICKVGEHNYILPEDFLFVTYSSSTKDPDLNTKDIHVSIKDSTNRYSLKGKEFLKYAKSRDQGLINLSEQDAAWISIFCGASEDDYEGLINSRPNTQFIFSNKLTCPLDFKEYVKEISKPSIEKTAAINSIRSNIGPILKFASRLGDVRSVDAILGLGVINEANLEAYLDNIPLFNEVANKLAHLLLTSRLGLDIDSKLIRNAMTNLSKVTIQLQNLDRARKNIERM